MNRQAGTGVTIRRLIRCFSRIVLQAASVHLIQIFQLQLIPLRRVVAAEGSLVAAEVAAEAGAGSFSFAFDMISFVVT